MLSTAQSLALLKKGVHFWNDWRMKNPALKPNLSNAYLVGASLAGVNFRELDLKQANLSHADLSGACMMWANLSGANLSGNNLQDAELIGANLSNDNLIGSDLSRDNLRQANLSGADLTGANLVSAYLHGADLTGANLSETDLHRVNLRDANLSGACLEAASLIEADCRNANFTRANLSSAKLKGADLRRVRAIATDFTEAILTGACIENWVINSTTKLDRAICDYIFLRPNQQERRPRDQALLFGMGGLARLVQTPQNGIDLLFTTGVDWRALYLALQSLQYNDLSSPSHAGSGQLSIEVIEQCSDGSLRVRLSLPPDVDSTEIERQVKRLYQAQLEILKASYHKDLQATDEQIKRYHQRSTNLMEVVRLMANRVLKDPVTPVPNAHPITAFR
jgi:uncharacterized protein YjbI with pentapeptide repeats